jgi:DNA-binding transcriptional MocR family regulator
MPCTTSTTIRRRTRICLGAAKKAGNPTRVILFGSTSKITFASAGVSFVAGSKEMMAWLGELMGTQMISPNKVEQYRHVLFLAAIPAASRA